MLMISRRKGDRIVLGDDTEIVVAEIHRRTVRLAVSAAPGTQVMRGEVRDAIEQENRRAAQSDFDTPDEEDEPEPTTSVAAPVSSPSPKPMAATRSVPASAPCKSVHASRSAL
jgi:carbon storage regulator